EISGGGGGGEGSHQEDKEQAVSTAEPSLDKKEEARVDRVSSIQSSVDEDDGDGGTLTEGAVTMMRSRQAVMMAEIGIMTPILRRGGRPP
ncbi:hypothetical protein ACHAW5_005664, partial [Stephanodiscus triporus]